jgi:hypothetical protein
VLNDNDFWWAGVIAMDEEFLLRAAEIFGRLAGVEWDIPRRDSLTVLVTVPCLKLSDAFQVYITHMV